MALESVPWFIGGGAEHSPSVCRLLPYIATVGAEGVVNGSDLKVSPLGTPGAGILIGVGACVINNRSAGASRESYLGRANSTITVSGLTAVPAGSGRSDLVVIRVKDPEFSPWTAPADLANGPYIEAFVIEGVPAGTTSAVSLGLGYSAIAIARLDRAASSTVVNSGDIVDLRQIVISRQEREIELGFPTANVDNDAANGTYKTMWTSGSTLTVPSWATTAIINMSVSGLAVVTAASTGKLRANFGGGAAYSQETLTDENWGGSTERTTYTVAGRITVPTNKRGIATTIALQATRTGGTGRLRVDAGTTIVADVQFQERPE